MFQNWSKLNLVDIYPQPNHFVYSIRYFWLPWNTNKYYYHLEIYHISSNFRRDDNFNDHCDIIKYAIKSTCFRDFRIENSIIK